MILLAPSEKNETVIAYIVDSKESLLNFHCIVEPRFITLMVYLPGGDPLKECIFEYKH